MSHLEFFEQKFDKTGVQRAELSAGVRGAPEKLLFLLLAPQAAQEERERKC